MGKRTGWGWSWELGLVAGGALVGRGSEYAEEILLLTGVPT